MGGHVGAIGPIRGRQASALGMVSSTGIEAHGSIDQGRGSLKEGDPGLSSYILMMGQAMGGMCWAIGRSGSGGGLVWSGSWIRRVTRPPVFSDQGGGLGTWPPRSGWGIPQSNTLIGQANVLPRHSNRVHIKRRYAVGAKCLNDCGHGGQRWGLIPCIAIIKITLSLTHPHGLRVCWAHRMLHLLTLVPEAAQSLLLAGVLFWLSGQIGRGGWVVWQLDRVGNPTASALGLEG
ncbi:hypothetical protein C8Q74DRAFT_1222749 [Fomes fomentarius]|nr:hypothetical protein C8Q74DRAFT_1222749 [Fomes fomentarius]